MFIYSITKYDNYTCDFCDWTSISDIGKTYNGKVLTEETYKKFEDAYVNAIIVILDFLNIDALKIRDIGRWKNLRLDIEELSYKDLYTEEMLSLYSSACEECPLSVEQAKNIMRLLLREDIGGHLYYENKLDIYIGYDMEMGVGVINSIDNIRHKIEYLGLHIEKQGE